ncbi:hypothetical protein CGCF415_v014251 [Colletotrichum fructicola]|uniref:Uncharacterized protein n=1 Tax=Colletotrichum fructicola (strain Nara gc5) TaxID=1213859 RepID=A0A7J6JE13_COLFN|nr:hypothetical protein CGGC5_v004423 [Colletotrichum fructicola Nara gc5]KAF4884126.1 hypothetical protein CGCFRS4_v012978 [Colletotrichum fructicola]KAF4889059.1 hypothetical protein CGCF415_v014251 [Colletotrichum fructicola]KAF4923735.1 hypothetical protein CGCF245_v014833 [Colletotrichum fructicola]
MRASAIRNLRQEGVFTSTSDNWDLLTVAMHAMPRFAGLSNSDITPHTRAEFQTGGEVKKLVFLAGMGLRIRES